MLSIILGASFFATVLMEIFPKAGFNAVAIYAAEQVLTHPLPVSRFYFGMVVMASLYAEWSIRREAARMNQNG